MIVDKSGDEEPVSLMEQQQQATEKVSWPVRLAWATGSITDNIMTNALAALVFPIYQLALGVDPRFLGWALAIPRMWDAFADPIIGGISDNTRTRWGRRKPFTILGAFLSGILFVIIWSPPAGWSTLWIGVFFLVVSFFYYTAYAIFTIPWNAMGLELSSDYNERTAIQATRMFLASVGGMLMGGLWKFCQWLGPNGNEVVGAHRMGLIFGALIIVSGLIPAIFCKEKTAVLTQEKLGLKAAIQQTLKNRAFLLLVGIFLCAVFGVFLVSSFSLYINLYYIYSGDKSAAASMSFYMNLVYQITGLVCTPLIAWIAGKLGKRNTVLIGLGMVTISSASSWYLFTPQYPFLQAIVFILASPGLGTCWIVGSSMLADLCDIDELQTGLRREGMYGAVYSWIFKTGIALTLVISGYLLSWSGFDSTPGAMQTVATVTSLRILYAVVPVVFLTIGFMGALKYPVTQRYVDDVQLRIRTRKEQKANMELPESV